ncbi:AAT family amino acid transporter [Exophiala aquamarina CBS 119918]|uniref:AAT family amino acid transporter n=1 Tax=Exophiala aquamarina CBS 119918 TaxID=1182545 RepID=A0A072P2U4_9EURO|nr:AAT family amino acid transporter [Exophiala aquamarina CBS 119918]KEF54161.1 AAT family amino acid transporter [Exophiala aquamarina CBS 119918]
MQAPPQESIDYKMEKDMDLCIKAVDTVQSNIEAHSEPLEHTSTKQGLKSRHAQMIALGGTIGTGLFSTTQCGIMIVMVVIVALNTLPVLFYGEPEFRFASIMVFGILGLLIMAFIFVLGGGANHQRLGFHYWNNPASIHDELVTGASGKLCAFLGTTIFSMYAFPFAPELLVVTEGEMESPRRNLPVAGKPYFRRLVIFYVLGVVAISVIVPSDDPKLLNGGAGAVSLLRAVAIKNAGISGFDSVVNAIILTSSPGNSCLYMAGRALYSMAAAGSAQKVFMRCNNQEYLIMQWLPVPLSVCYHISTRRALKRQSSSGL